MRSLRRPGGSAERGHPAEGDERVEPGQDHQGDADEVSQENLDGSQTRRF
jgi:hypothetical protein